MVNEQYCNCAHRSHAALWKRSLKSISPNVEQAHGPHHLEAAPWKGSREPIVGDDEFCDCAHRSHAALWKRSLKAIPRNVECAYGPHHLEASLWNVFGKAAHEHSATGYKPQCPDSTVQNHQDPTTLAHSLTNKVTGTSKDWLQ
eukprot:638994-Amphidinium_carterae.1